MNPKVLAVLLIAGNLAFTSVSKAQMWGTGMWGGMQACGYPYGAAAGANDDNDEINELQELRKDLRKEKRDLEKKLRDLESKKEKYTTAINDVINPEIAGAVIDHMENGYSCRTCAPVAPPPPGGGGYTPVGEDETVDQPDVPVITVPEPPARPRPQPAKPEPRDPVKASDIFEPADQTRMPASFGLSAGSGVAGGGERYSFLRGGGGGGGFAGGPECGAFVSPNAELYAEPGWQRVCREGGRFSKELCRNRMYLAPDAKGDSLRQCADAVDNFRKVTKDIDDSRAQISRIEDQISQIGLQIGDLKRDRKSDRELEASCPTGDCHRPRRKAEKSSNWTSTLLPLLAGVGAGLGAEALGYFTNRQNNKNLNALGYPTMPYAAGSYGLPFIQAGIYGAVAGGTQGGFGCAPGMMGGGPFSPYGMMGPFGQMNPYGMGGMSPFGYPQGFFPNAAMGGGMFMPGMGPWGMAGPWGNGFNPYMGAGLAGGMMMPGMAGGMMMPGMAGGMMMPGMAGMAGGMAMGGGMMMPGMAGMAGGFGMAMPGMAGGIGMAMPGMAGGFGLAMPGMAGMAGGMAMGGGMMMPGMAGMAGMAMPGMAGGFTSPYGVAGGFSMGGFLTPTPMMGQGGMGVQYQQQMLQMQLQQYQMQLDMQRRAADNAMARSRVQQGLMTEYYSLMYRINQVNSGGYGLGFDLSGGGLGGVGGGLGIGVQTPYIPYTTGGSAVGIGTTPGRTR